MSRLKSVSRVQIIFLLASVFLLTLSIISFNRIKDLVQSAALLNHSYVVKLELEKIYVDLRDAGTNQRGYTLARDSVFARNFNSSLRRIEMRFHNLDSLLKDNSVQRKNVEVLQGLFTQRIRYLKKSIHDLRAGDMTKENWLAAKMQMDLVRAHIDNMLVEEDRLLRERNQDVTRDQFITPLLTIVLIASCILILIAAYFKIIDDLKMARNLQQQLVNRTTELEKNNVELSAQKTFIETIFDSSIDSISVFDKELSYLTLNKKAEEVIGIKKEKIVGKRIEEIFPKIISMESYSDLQKALKGEAIHHTRYHSLLNDRYYENFFVPLRNNGEITGVVTLVHDITNLVETTEALKLKNEELEERTNFVETIFNSSVDIIMVLNTDFCYIAMNKKAQEAYAPLGNVIGKNMFEVNPELKNPETEVIFQRVLNGEIVHVNKFKSLLYDKYYENDYIPLKKKGEVYAVMLVVHDITENIKAADKLNEASERLKKSEERYHRMVAEVEDYAILFLNREGVIENWNIGAEKIQGYKAHEITGNHFSVFYTIDDLKNKLPQKLIDEALNNGRATQEGWRVRKDGSRFWGSVVITALHNDQNDIIGFSKVTRDLTERKMAEENLKAAAVQLEKQNTELAQKNAELTQFAYVSSHDLQEPLRKIQTFASRIVERENENLSSYVRDYLERIESAAERMQTLIEDLLTYSRTNSSERIFELTDLNMLVQEVITELSEQISEKNAIINLQPLPSIKIIAFQFHQLLTNLINNALKFTRENQQPLITITSAIIKGEEIKELVEDHKRNYFHFIIKDNGIGFEPEYSKKIFDVFQRLHGRHEYKGTGIGLAICKRIVENHNGVITAEGALGEGAVFNIYIPV